MNITYVYLCLCLVPVSVQPCTISRFVFCGYYLCPVSVSMADPLFVEIGRTHKIVVSNRVAAFATWAYRIVFPPSVYVGAMTWQTVICIRYATGRIDQSVPIITYRNTDR